MKLKNIILISALATLAIGCSNATLQEMHPNDGVINFCSFDGKALKTYKTNGKPEMATGGHIYFKDSATGKLVILYGVYSFEENK
jgi:hypothetical protein